MIVKFSHNVFSRHKSRTVNKTDLVHKPVHNPLISFMDVLKGKTKN